MLAAACMLGCQRSSSSLSSQRPAQAPQDPRLPTARRVDPEVPALVPAARCGECHGPLENEWRESAHAKADTSPLYRRMRAASGSQDCDSCHAPLRRFARQDPAAEEGVTCDACHMLRIDKAAAGVSFSLHPEDNVRYGPLCDSQPHYFHRMGCSPLHRESEFCAACHDGNRHLPGSTGASRSLFPEYEEWRSEYSAQGSHDCQVCHMPASRREAAVGSHERPEIRHHGFRLHGRLLGQALQGQAHVRRDAQALTVDVQLRNDGAGHAVPSGLPERRLQVGVELLDERGRVVAQVEHSRGRFLVDERGHEAPFYAAVRDVKDSRIRPGQTEHSVFTLPLRPASQLRIFVRRRPLSWTIAQQLGVTAPADEPMLQATLPLAQLGTAARHGAVAISVRLQP